MIDYNSINTLVQDRIGDLHQTAEKRNLAILASNWAAIQTDYNRAMIKGRWYHFVSLFRGKNPKLIAFDEVYDQQMLKSQHELGTCIVPIDRIVGSMGQCTNFDRAFYPSKSTTRDRWTSIARAYYETIALPLVELYKVGEAYFVNDGHHRISVARARGQRFIKAAVIEIEL